MVLLGCHPKLPRNELSSTGASIPSDALPSPKLDPRWALVSKTTELWGLEGMLPALSTKRGRGGVLKLRDGTRKRTSFTYLLELVSNQPTSWLIHILEHPWC